MKTVLAIETSCDETAAAVICDHEDRGKRIRSNVIYSQLDEHEIYGGVVPEIAARAHLQKVQEVIRSACDQAEFSLSDIDALAVTAGPGLIGGVMVGVMTAKAMAASLNTPLLMINHLEGHALTARLTDDVAFPYLLLLISGGHCQFVIAHEVGHYETIGSTIDDALGEAFDKCAKMMGLPYPGGPHIEALAKQGDAARFALPKPLCDKPGCDMSFAGLKTAVRYQLRELQAAQGQLTQQDKCDMAASFQRTVSEVLEHKVAAAMALAKESVPKIERFVIAGGVAANQAISHAMRTLFVKHGWSLIVPPPGLCTDNAAMIGWAAIERLRLNKIEAMDEALAFSPRARWPLAELG